MPIIINKSYHSFNLIIFNKTILTEKSIIAILGFNFSIYNAADWNNIINNGNIWLIPYINNVIYFILEVVLKMMEFG